MEATIAQALLTLAILLVFGGFLVWALRTRQFHDVEEANRRLFGDQNQETPPCDESTDQDTAPTNGKEPE